MPSKSSKPPRSSIKAPTAPQWVGDRRLKYLQRQADRGIVRVTSQIHGDDVDKLRAYVASLNARRWPSES